MAGHPGMSPREVAAVDQFGAAFRDSHERLTAALTAAGDQLEAMSRSLAGFGDELRVTGLYLAVDDTEAMAAHPDLGEVDTSLDQWYGSRDG